MVYIAALPAVTFAAGWANLDGPMKDPWFTEWTSLAAVAAVSLVVYYWAKAVSLPAERIRAHVGEVAVVDAGGH